MLKYIHRVMLDNNSFRPTYMLHHLKENVIFKIK